MAWLEANRTMVISDYHRAFVAAFGRNDVTAANLHGLRKRRRWMVGRSPDRYKGRNTKYSSDELAWLRDNVSMETPACLAAFSALFGRSDMTAGKLSSLRKRHKWRTGRTGRFEAGAVSHNKGKKMPFNANSARTQFKKGQMPVNHRGPGHESRDKDGYVWVVTDRRNPWTGASTWRVHKHRWLWELANGPIPKGMALKCLGDKTNCDPSNWELVPKGLLPRLNGKSGRNFDSAPCELKPTIMAVAKLEHRLRERKADL